MASILKHRKVMILVLELGENLAEHAKTTLDCHRARCKWLVDKIY